MLPDVSRQRDGLTSLNILTVEVRSTSRLQTGSPLADKGRTERKFHLALLQIGLTQ